MKSTPDALWTLSRDELSMALEPHYLNMRELLSDSERKQITFDQAVDSAYDRLRHAAARNFTFTQASALVRNDLSPCAFAVAVVVADSFIILFQFCGINQAQARAATRALLQELGEETLRGLRANIHDIVNATSSYQQAVEIWKLLSSVSNVIGISSIVTALTRTMHWYDWTISAIIIAAQLTAWFASDGAALIAELALESVYVGQLVADAITAAEQCG
ncbi:UNVERIFIED_ORG: hypothetical protein ABIC54_000571 [Burkholderia sp. 1263]